MSKNTGSAIAEDMFIVEDYVSLPTFEQKPGLTNYFECVKPMVTKKTTEVDKDGKSEEKEITVMQVKNLLQDGAMGEIVVASVLKSTFIEKFPDQKEMVGKIFKITKSAEKKSGKRYYTYEVAVVSLKK